MTPTWLQGLRALRSLLHVLQGLLVALLVFPWCGKRLRTWLTRAWSRKVLIILNIKVTRKGGIPEHDGIGAVFVANHISWLDIWLLDSLHPCRFISKAEVRHWPLVGFLATRAGTLYIERERKRHAASLNREVEAVLQAGESVALFPEGTTSDGRQLRRFYGSLLQPAVQVQAPLLPVALRYVEANGDIDETPAFINDMTMLDSLKQILRKRKIHAEIEFLPPIPTRGLTRREAALAAQQAIATALRLPSPGTTPETASDLPAAAR